MKTGVLLFLSAVLLIGTFSLAIADGGANHQKQNNNYGVTGGNVKDITKSFCCSGTLGALIKNGGGTQYILSNNHVLAREDQAASGEDISQPGLVDNNCKVPRIVADFTAAPHLGTNVDAAIAKLRSGTMNTTGRIEDVGIPSINIVSSPSVGLAVAKSGRTTGFTTGKIGSVNASVKVTYQKSCGSGKKFTISYTNQIVINSSSFSAGGDSGSLIVSNTSSSCRRPVGLLFAGSSSTTIANPITNVLSGLHNTTGQTYTFVGQNCTAPSAPTQMEAPSGIEMNQALNVLNGHRDELMAYDAVIGVGIGALASDPSHAAIIVYMDKTQRMLARIPRTIDGVPVRVISTEPFVAF